MILSDVAPGENLHVMEAGKPIDPNRFQNQAKANVPSGLG